MSRDDLTGFKVSQLDAIEKGKKGYVYYCSLCEEALVLSERMINPRKVSLVFGEKCPCCGFNLDTVLTCENCNIPEETKLTANPRCNDAQYLMESDSAVEFTPTTPSMPKSESTLTVGLDAIDRALSLTYGQFAVITGKASHSFSALLCVRAVRPAPSAFDTDAVFIDAGNSFDSYLISEQSIRLGIDPETVLRRIHLSRAFTFHQVSRLLNEKLPHALEEFKARLAVVSDITQLYCDPDIQNKQEALNVLRRDAKSLAILAEKKSVLIVATNMSTRNRRMDNILLRSAHISANLEDRRTFTRLTVAKHPFKPQLRATVSLSKETLEAFL
jgi:hypothetical protein